MNLEALPVTQDDEGGSKPPDKQPAERSETRATAKGGSKPTGDPKGPTEREEPRDPASLVTGQETAVKGGSQRPTKDGREAER